MLLTIDAGNTRTKWALWDSVGVSHGEGACLNEDFPTADIAPAHIQIERVVVSNVAGLRYAETISQKFVTHELMWVTACTQACGVVNQYGRVETLGSDRWAAIIAAWHLNQNSCVVVNAGTATTVDALLKQSHGGAFLGGMILPGLDLMQQSLGRATAKLPTTTAATYSSLKVDSFAKSTENAMFSGAINATTGAIAHMCSALEKEGKQKPHIVMSGGNAQLIATHFCEHDSEVAKSVVVVDNLVLQGLYLLGQESSF